MPLVVSRTAHLGTRSTSRSRAIPARNSSSIVAPGTGTAAIGRRLVEAGVIRDELAFRAALWWTGRSRDLQAGEYRFDRPMAAVDVVERLARGDVYTRRLTFPEGLTIREMAEIFETRGFGRRAALRRSRAQRVARSRISMRTRAISRDTCFPKPTRFRARRRPRG